MYTPQATYRLQLHADFNLEKLQDILDYLQALGVSTIYASPILAARLGSTHGYDVVDPLNINPEVGTEASLTKISQELKQRNIGWVQDIVPNHMAFDTDNPWITNLLELGPRSPFFTHFDVDWWNENPENYGKLMFPILGELLISALESNQIRLSYDDRGLVVRYYEHRIPLNATSYTGLLTSIIDQVGEQESKIQLTRLLVALQPFSPDTTGVVDPEKWQQFKNEWLNLFCEDKFRLMLTDAIDQLSNSKDFIKELLDKQHFRLVYWKTTEGEIYYRRFFTVNDLICLNMQNPTVFEDYHQLLHSLVQKNIFQGLRIDHVDGLFDPTQYLDQLRDLVGKDTYLVVEKILEGNEKIPTQWPIQGTTGYDFLVQANRFFSSSTQSDQLSDLYQQWTPEERAYTDIVYDNKMLILRERMQGELNNLTRLLETLEIIPDTNTASSEELQEALAHVLVAFPVYRIYDNQLPLSKQSLQLLGEIFSKANEKVPQLLPALNTLRIIFNGVPDKSEEVNKNTLYFIQRCQQFSGPLAAKGIEDTTFYQYYRLISRNEVGDSPDHLGMTIDELHQWLQSRSLLTMNATATHDTKRGEDARIRINVLSEQVAQWADVSKKWKKQHQTYCTNVAGKHYPTDNDIYFIYQTLVGTYPLHISPLEDNYAERLGNYLEKAVREAKTNTTWSSPNSDYEKSLIDFAKGILSDPDFIEELTNFVRPLARKSVAYSLGQTVLKIMAPGVPDIYQGTEFWDLSMVDPDNRRAVDYSSRTYLLKQFVQNTDTLANAQQLAANPDDPAIKMYTLFRSLQLRQRWPALFSESY
ncbi:MAG: malto-oligosyltrehalose synthase [Tunicatimonas sp.]|uniref:malto-oligosyltrehalose synthase n=1 Tax=Tunicatimonas sp. TaxID=1940096 RepID=UPI003C712528